MKTALRIAWYQLLIATLAGLAWALSKDGMSGLAAFTGGAINAAITGYVGWLNFGVADTHPDLILKKFYRSQMRKLALSAVLFGAAVLMFRTQLLPLATTFSVGFVVYWFALLWKNDV